MERGLSWPGTIGFKELSILYKCCEVAFEHSATGTIESIKQVTSIDGYVTRCISGARHCGIWDILFFVATVKMIYVCLLQIILKLECGPMPNVMVALPNMGGALCSTPQSLADAHY